MAPEPPGAFGQSRPGMRRKSSAQNMFASLRTNISVGAVPAGPTTSAGIMQIPGGALSSGLVGMPVPASTPTATSSAMNREWDAQSMVSDSVASSNAPLNPSANGSPALGPGTTVESLRDLVTKRMITLTYMRNVHEGRSHWFNTIMMTRADMERVFSNTAMKKRTHRFAILGMSLSHVFDITNCVDLLKGLLNILNEYDQTKDENYKPKMRLFRTSKFAKRQAGGVNDYTILLGDAGDASYLITPHMPFPLDYHQTLLSLLDILSEVYHKISKLLGPSPFPHSGQYMMGPLGVLTPHPGVSYLFQGSESGHSSEAEGSLWGIANGTHITNGIATAAHMSPPAVWTPSLGDMVLKIDNKLKKIIATLLKDLDAFARNAIKDELASLDPLLRNMAVPDTGREQYDFEGFL